MVPISNHCYRVGPSIMIELTREQSLVLQSESSTSSECFIRLFKDGEIYHSTSYKDNKSLRNNTICSFKHNNSICYGEIVLFLLKRHPVALINVLYKRGLSLTDQAGNPGRETLMPYKDVNLLEKYFIPIDADKSSLIAVGLNDIKSKYILVETDTIKCVVVLPNKYEHH